MGKWFTVVGLALAAAGCSGISTTSDWDETFDFSSLSTYAWMDQGLEGGVSEIMLRRMKMAVEDSDFITQSFLKWFLDEQREEMATANKVLDIVRMAGDNLILVEMMVEKIEAAAEADQYRDRVEHRVGESGQPPQGLGERCRPCNLAPQEPQQVSIPEAAQTRLHRVDTRIPAVRPGDEFFQFARIGRRGELLEPALPVVPFPEQRIAREVADGNDA